MLIRDAHDVIGRNNGVWRGECAKGLLCSLASTQRVTAVRQCLRLALTRLAWRSAPFVRRSRGSSRPFLHSTG